MVDRHYALVAIGKVQRAQKPQSMQRYWESVSLLTSTWQRRRPIYLRWPNMLFSESRSRDGGDSSAFIAFRSRQK